MAIKSDDAKLRDLEKQQQALQDKINKQKEKIRKQREAAIAKNLKEIRKILEGRGIDLAEDNAVTAVENILVQVVQQERTDYDDSSDVNTFHNAAMG